jgi:hypothetical protein
MTLQGKVQNGVVVLEGGAALPEGTPVTVVVEPSSPAPSERTPEEQRRRRAALAELLALPDENPGDTFSGADHDKILYGDRE